MRTGLMVALIGAVGFMAAGLGLHWQRFELAGVDATALELGWGGALALLASLAVAVAAGVGLVTGRRAMASAVGVMAGLVALGWVLVSRVDPLQGLEVMADESVSASAGFFVALLGVLLMLGGTIMTRAHLPSWDLSMPLLRVMVLRRGVVAHEAIVYEPKTISLREIAGLGAGDVRVTREGDVHVGWDGPLTVNGRQASGPLDVAVGDRVTLRSESAGELTEVLFHHVAPVPGKSPAPLLQRSEIAAFALVAVFAHGAVFAVPILGWQVEAQRAPSCEGGRCAGVVAQAEIEPLDTRMEVTMPDSSEEVPETLSSKAAGGPEGVFGDPRVADPVVSKVPRRDGPMVERVDPRKVGLLSLVDTKLGANDVVAEVLRGDVAATSRSIAAAMAGDGQELVLGRGTNGLSWRGDGEGGPGDGTGRIMGQGDIDTGGPGIKTALGDPPKKRKVGALALGAPSQTGYCKASAIESVVKRRAAAIRACYEQRLQVNDGLRGKLSVRWTIGMDGKVQTAAAIEDSLGDPQTAQCVLGWVRRMQFEKPDGGLCVVQWPFVFSNR